MRPEQRTLGKMLDSARLACRACAAQERGRIADELEDQIAELMDRGLPWTVDIALRIERALRPQDSEA